MKQPRIAFCPADANNDKFFHQLENSLRKFHSTEELPLVRTTTNGDPAYFYKACPLEAKRLLQEYDTVIKLDADQIITGSLSDIWEGDFDVATVLNDPNFPITVWDVQSPYYNMGLVVMKNPEFVEHWWRLCQSPHFDHYQYREQDLLNLLCSDYFNYNVKELEVDHIYGESAKPLWATAYLEGDKLMLDKEHDLRVIHFGGGNDPSKGNLKIRFREDVVKWLEKLIQ